jgi:hypothetical protein
VVDLCSLPFTMSRPAFHRRILSLHLRRPSNTGSIDGVGHDPFFTRIQARSELYGVLVTVLTIAQKFSIGVSNWT